eukprot:CAMPEP_0115146364 /NCGR_PEP_ID=MMETSP0227-20121206/62661_1 /TAXON_ID=89957 /ORGANISM="Polarella glacialis, Strain CCMP 1383" /LENGTH=355 /DNA_ID=CAMNT_0002556047 /DNA_START=21 /DNA_END=1090 /DNA_ORIENTATION=+
MANDVMVVMTSNRPPADLYKDGLNHMMYMPPFRQLLETTIGVHHIDAPQDYRAAKAAAESANGQAEEANYMVLPTAAGALEEAFERASGSTLEKAGSCQLAVSWGRRLECPAAHAGVSWFSFSQLCATALSADDYSVLLQKNAIHTLVLSDVPRFALEQHNEARRFTNLVDCLYEHQGRLICTAEAPLDSLMAEMEILSHVPLTTQPAMGIAGSEVSLRKHGDVTFAVSDKSPCRPDSFATEAADAEAGTAEFDPIMVAIKAARLAASKAAMGLGSNEESDGAAGVMSVALVSLQESGFAARRCVSRLREMGTAEYLSAHRARWGTAKGDAASGQIDILPWGSEVLRSPATSRVQ